MSSERNDVDHPQNENTRRDMLHQCQTTVLATKIHLLILQKHNMLLIIFDYTTL